MIDDNKNFYIKERMINMKKKYIKLIKIFLALVLVFSQLSNAMVVLAEEVSDNNASSYTDTDTTDTELQNDSENKENIPGEGEVIDPENKEETPADGEVIDPENKEETPTDGEVVDPEGKGSAEEVREFTPEDLEKMMDSYLNGTELDEELVNLLIAYEAPSIVDGEFSYVTIDDIMFVNELLKEEPDLETEREENVNLKLELGEVPEEVSVSKEFKVQILVSNEEEEKTTEEDTEIDDTVTPEEEETLITPEFIDGIEGLIETNDKLRLVSVEYETFTGLFNEEGFFVAAGDEYGEDKGVLLTLTFEALEEGTGEVAINGNLAKYQTIYAFDSLTFSIEVTPKVLTGLEGLWASVGTFDKEFDSEVTEYTLIVPAGTTEVTLSGALLNEESEVTGLSTYTLEEDETTVEVTVTEVDGTVKTYLITIVREAVEQPSETVSAVEEVSPVAVEEPAVTPITYVYTYSSNNYLKSLSIKNYEINFDKGVLEYKIKVPADIKTLDITAVAEDYRSRVEINGNEEFKEGENVVTIKVTAENGEVREYKIRVNKEAKDTDIDELEENNGKVEKIVIIILIVLVVAGLLYLIFKKDDETSETVKTLNNKKTKER